MNEIKDFGKTKFATFDWGAPKTLPQVIVANLPKMTDKGFRKSNKMALTGVYSVSLNAMKDTQVRRAEMATQLASEEVICKTEHRHACDNLPKQIVILRSARSGNDAIVHASGN